MTEMAIKITEEMSDAAFASLAASVIRGESREVPRPMPGKSERQARPKAELPAARQASADWPEMEAVATRIEDRATAVKTAKAREASAHERVGRPKHLTRSVKVDSPYGRATNGVDRVERVVDTIDLMLRARQIDRDQEAAARMVQDAWAAAPGNIRCALSAGEGGAGPGSRSITSQQEWAGGILNDVRKKLGELDSLVVVRICGIGFSVEQTARMMFAVIDGQRVRERQRDHVGMRLRLALACLAKHWNIGSRRPKTEGLKSFATMRAPGVDDEIGALTGGNRAEIEAERERVRAMGEHAAKRIRRAKKSGALPARSP